MIEATLTLAALIPLAGFAGWRVGRSWSDAELAAQLAERPNIDDYRAAKDAAEARLAEALAELDNLPRRNAKGQYVRREP